jgi:hypothetical protein
MEIIQYFQYKVIDQCNNKINRYLTILGYIHICFQPLFFNLWLFAFTVKPIVQYLYMSFFGGLMLASRLFYVKNNELCDASYEPLCGKRTCSVSGERHIAWNVRLRAPDWVTPSISLHFFLWFFPALSMFHVPIETRVGSHINCTLFRLSIDKQHTRTPCNLVLYICYSGHCHVLVVDAINDI